MTSRTQTDKQKRSKKRFALPMLLVGGIAVVLFVFGLRNFLIPISVFSKIVGDVELAETDGYTNVLLLGLDRRSTRMSPGGLNDTIMVASFNKDLDKTFLISIPRDLWVPFGDGYYGKINSAFSHAGIENMIEVVSNVLGIPIHYYVVVDFKGFERGIDTLGGLDIYVERVFDDFKYPIEGKEDVFPEEDRYEHVHFDQGWQTMDGETALKFARSRMAVGPEGSDFARSKRQQAVLLAARDKAFSSSTLFNPIKLKELYDVFGSTVDTDITISEAQKFYEVGKKLNLDNLVTEVLDRSNNGEARLLYTPQDLEEYDNAWVLVPTAGDFSEVQRHIYRLLFVGE